MESLPAMPALVSRHDHMAMPTISDDMNVGTIDVLWIPQVYWIFVGSVIAAFTLANILNKLLFRQRILAARSNKALAAKPKTYFWSLHATLTAVTREIGNFSSPSFKIGKLNFVQPTFGALLLVLANAVLLVVLCLYALNLNNLLEFQNIGYRTGFVSLGQMPFIFLLAGKNNVIGWLTGSSYERINHLHRWVARTLLLTTTLHMAYWFRDWAPFNFIGVQVRNSPTTQRGLIAWSILVWIVFSSFAPIRGWSYEIFVLQHTLSYVAFVTMLFLHTPTSDHPWLWAPVAIYVFDRIVRALYTVYTNLTIFHPKQKREAGFSGLWACRAEFTPMSHNATQVTIHNPPIQWQPGQHALFSCHSVVPLQSHPFTISSLTQDGKLQFIIKAQRGGTRRMRSYAEKCIGLPSQQTGLTISSVPVVIEGPFGRMRPLRQFDSIVLVAGSTGVSFTMPLLRDLVRHWKIMATGESPETPGFLGVLKTPEGAVTRQIRFIWIVKSSEQITWFSRELAQVANDVALLRKQGVDVECNIAIHVTCDERFTTDYTDQPNHLQSSTIHDLNTSSAYEKLGATTPDADEKDPFKPTDQISIKEVNSRDSATANCGGRTCSCRSTAPSSSHDDIPCTCNDLASPASSLTGKRPLAPHPSITIRTGRPGLKRAIRAALESAHGESGIVSCGPRSLNEDCRRAVVLLSDERAACKGSGAMGVYYWGEGFGYA